MSITRRQFLILSSLTGFGLTALGKTLGGHTAQSSAGYTIAATAEEAATIASLRLSRPIFRFVSLADTGTGTRGQYVVAEAMTRYHQQHPFDLAILAGDNIYNTGEIQKIGEVFEKPYKPLLDAGVKFQACLGNHDIATDNGNPQVKYAGFNMLGRYYTFRRDSIQFFALDTNYNADWKTQLPWLEKELSSSDAPWKIVFGHHPVYSAGLHGSSKKLRQILPPLFEKYNVRLYINGHDHNYERTQVVKGTTYLTCGAGAGTRPVGHSEVTAHSVSKLSFAAIDIYPTHILLSGIDKNNQIFDQGIILLSS
ncbi:MAG: metallophosphoesterase [Microcoleus vaginatus WJT46-NPBG5]|jgi:acid phosphatase|nr:metallophosphoesterase [Microcoleus vaginatus WJT46-NPBG5]